MKYPAYPEYKDSGVEWLGAIPNGWTPKKLKFLSTYFVSNVDKIPAEDEVPVRLCNYTDVYYNDYITPDMGLMETTATPDEIRKFGLQPLDVIVTKDSEDWRDIAVPAMVVETAPDLVCGYHLAIVRPKRTQVDGEYLLRLFQSTAVNQQFRVAASGVTRYGLPKSSIGDAWIPVPTLEEQQAIARFLDAKTAKIDELIAKKRELIEKLKEKRSALIARTVTQGLPPEAALAVGLDPYPKMKDSGVEWLGQIPERWQVLPLARLAQSIQTGPFGTQLHQTDYVEDEIPLINPVHMIDGNILSDSKNTVTPETAERLSRYKLSYGDLVFARRGEIGRCAVVQSHQIGWLCGTGSMVVRLNANACDVEYYALVVRSKGFSSLLELNAVGTTMLNLNPTILGRMLVPTPPQSEQSVIVSFLRKESNFVDALLEKVESAIQELTEYRQALITAAVTGKIDVREAA